MEAGAIVPLVELLRSGSADAKEQAAAALANLAVNDANKAAIVEAGGIAPLIELVRSGSAERQGERGGALWNLTVNDANKVAIAEAGAIAPLVALVRRGRQRGSTTPSWRRAASRAAGRQRGSRIWR